MAERVTYLVANWNHAAFLPDCLRSLRQQTSPLWLALVHDDASTDASLAVIRSLDDPRITLHTSDQRLGYIAALERLIGEAATDIVAILDADDALTPAATERLLLAYAADPEVSFVYSRFALYDVTLTRCLAVYGTPVPPGGAALCKGEVGAVRSFRRSAYRRTAGLDPTMLYAEDRDLVYKLEEVTRPVFVDAVLYHYREVADSQSRAPDKRAIGRRNTWRARRAALRRRRVRGVHRLICEVLVCADYVAGSERLPGLVRRFAAWTGRAAAAIEERVPRRVHASVP